MNKEKYMSDLQDIREMMSRSTRFISLSGLSGVIIGIIAILATWLAYTTVYQGQDYFNYRCGILSREVMIRLLLIGGITLALSLSAGVILTILKVRKDKAKLWDAQTYRLLVNLFIPLLAGGILCLILLSKGFIGLIAPLTLVFYGLALVNASKYSLDELRSLGISEIFLGLLATYFIGYGLIFWALGFGLLHIVYGIFMHIKYGS